MARVFNKDAKGASRIVHKDIHPSGKIEFDGDGYVDLEYEQALKLSEVPGYSLEKEFDEDIDLIFKDKTATPDKETIVPESPTEPPQEIITEKENTKNIIPEGKETAEPGEAIIEDEQANTPLNADDIVTEDPGKLGPKKGKKNK